MNSSQLVFLDTSLQIERMIGALAQQEALEAHLARAGHRFVSSHYVFMEFQRALLADYVRVYLATYLATHPQAVKEQARLERLLHMVIDDPRAVLGQSTCWPLGDVIIALQALPAAHLWTIDADFQPLAQALGLALYTPDFR